MNISSNVNTIQSQQTMLNTSANNMQKNNADLSKEIPNQIVIQNVVEVNANVIKTKDDMLGTLLDIKS